ncbi:MAG: CRTAC1 family protein, partial [Planctomycetota bacterium]
LEKMPPIEELGRYRREDPIEMLPFAFPGQRNVYLRNLLAESGKLAFQDATEALRLEDVQGRGMQSVFWDFDQDGDDDLYVANDVSFNVLFRNEGDGTFKDVSFSTGLDDPRGGMGLAIGAVDRDGDEDVFLTNWQLEANAIYLNSVVGKKGTKRRRASFHDATVRSGLGPSGIGKTSWGAELLDLDLDGVLDLYVANGYTSPDYESTGLCVGQTDQLFIGLGKGRFRQVEADTKEPITLPPALANISQASRGAIGADHDRDGDVDLLITANNGRAVLLENRAPRAGRWVGLRLRQEGANVYAIGASITVMTDAGEKFRSTLRAGQGYLTGNAPELHFGLGNAERIESLEITWPDGEITRAEAALDAWQTIRRE